MRRRLQIAMCLMGLRESLARVICAGAKTEFRFGSFRHIRGISVVETCRSLPDLLKSFADMPKDTGERLVQARFFFSHGLHDHPHS